LRADLFAARNFLYTPGLFISINNNPIDGNFLFTGITQMRNGASFQMGAVVYSNELDPALDKPC
jgi:hypothetical protein